MGRKQLAWFIQHWLSFFEANTTTYNWQKAKKHHLQGNVRLLEISKGNLEASVKGFDNYHVKMVAKNLGADAALLLEKMISRNPVKLMKIYQGALEKEDVADDPHHLGFVFSKAEVNCSCGQANPGCSHSAAVALSAADYFNKDYGQFLIFNGLNLESILLHVGAANADWHTEEFTLLPVPEGSVRSFDHRIGAKPDFWTSSFPFMRMLEEILLKIREEAKKIGT